MAVIAWRGGRRRLVHDDGRAARGHQGEGHGQHDDEGGEAEDEAAGRPGVDPAAGDHEVEALGEPGSGPWTDSGGPLTMLCIENHQ